MDPFAILSAALAERGLARIDAGTLADVMSAAGLVLTGGSRQAADAHLAEVARLGKEHEARIRNAAG
jgi:hypothetical protein